jgi:hypothetical protein
LRSFALLFGTKEAICAGRFVRHNWKKNDLMTFSQIGAKKSIIFVPANRTSKENHSGNVGKRFHAAKEGGSESGFSQTTPFFAPVKRANRSQFLSVRTF